MTHFKFLIPVLIVLAACGGKKEVDEQALLESLKQQQSELSVQIDSLERKLNPESQEKAVAVAIQEAKGCEFKHYVEVQGTVDGDQNVTATAQMPGVVTAIYKKQGDFVNKGQVIAELDAKVLKQNLKGLVTQLELATVVFEKQKALWDKNIGSEIQYLQAKNQKESLEDSKKALEEQIQLTKIVSPISGSIENNNLKLGEMVSPGMPNSTVRIINMSSAKVVAKVAESYALKVQKGNDVVIKFPDLGKSIETKLAFTAKYIDPSSRTFEVECKFPGKDLDLRANMIAYVAINDYTNPAAFCVPVNVVLAGSEGKYVYVAEQTPKGFIASQRQVKTGMDYNGQIEILEGINAGDKLIVTGYQNVKKGHKIEF
jgi:RND family efflux transporter MFP subunit